MISGNGVMAAYSMQAMPLHTSGRAILLFVNGFFSSDFLYTEKFYMANIEIYAIGKYSISLILIIKMMLSMIEFYMYMFFLLFRMKHELSDFLFTTLGFKMSTS